MVLEKTLESPLDCKEIQPVQTKGNQSWIFTGEIDAEPETPILWLPGVKSWLIGKDPVAGKDLVQEKEVTDGWIASLSQWTWVWVNSKSWWWTGRPGMLQSMGLQRVRQDWVTELNWTDMNQPWGYMGVDSSPQGLYHFIWNIDVNYQLLQPHAIKEEIN